MPIDRDKIESNLRLHVDRLAGLIGPRTLERPKTIVATIGYIKSQWNEMEYDIGDERYDALGNEATNLIVEQKGSKRSDEIVLLGAHYDTVFMTPGADDNASAVPVLIEVSDNSSFWDQGYQALMLTDTSFLRNPNYHLESDTPETLDYGRMTEVTLGVASD